ncbi:hypothetical protein M0805_001552 [Coniferiporia weirii]|nr:hypothetical protein M0805_001552 [Coniferiporia weirii]
MALVTRGIVQEATEQIFILQYYTIASITILYYDHINTFPVEVQRIWGRRLTLSSTLFLLNRYITSLGYLPIIYFIFNPPDDMMTIYYGVFLDGRVLTSTPSCRNFARLGGYLSLFTQVIIAIMLSIRTYALYNRSLKVLGFTAALGLASIITSAYSLTQFYGILLEFGLGLHVASAFRTCLPGFIHSSAPFKVTILLSFIFDIVIFLLTITRTYQVMGEHKRCGMHSPLYKLLMRDGSVYFAVMVLVNAINFALFDDKYVQSAFFPQSTGNNSMMTHVISVTMMSRLILNLNSVGNQRRVTVSPAGSHMQGNSTTGMGDEDDSADVTQFTTHISRYSTWVARAAEEFETDFMVGTELRTPSETMKSRAISTLSEVSSFSSASAYSSYLDGGGGTSSNLEVITDEMPDDFLELDCPDGLADVGDVCGLETGTH